MSANGFPTFVSAQLQHLLTHSPHLVKVQRAWSGSKYLPGSLDRFTLLIPYCLDYLRCSGELCFLIIGDFFYNAEFPLAPPDVIFELEDEQFLPFLVPRDGVNMVLDKSCFSDWDYSDHTCLLSLVEELRDKYAEYQRICLVHDYMLMMKA